MIGKSSGQFWRVANLVARQQIREDVIPNTIGDKEQNCKARTKMEFVRHALRDAVAGVKGVRSEGGGKLPQVVGFMDFCVKQFAA